MAVEHNLVVLKRAAYDSTLLKEGDEVEVRRRRQILPVQVPSEREPAPGPCQPHRVEQPLDPIYLVPARDDHRHVGDVDRRRDSRRSFPTVRLRVSLLKRPPRHSQSPIIRPFLTGTLTALAHRTTMVC